MEEPKAQQDIRFLKGRQIAHITYDYIKISGTCKALLNINRRSGQLSSIKRNGLTLCRAQFSMSAVKTYLFKGQQPGKETQEEIRKATGRKGAKTAVQLS